MNTNGLARHYATLTPRERLPLLVAALNRRDETEAARLARSAPAAFYKIADYFPLGEALRLLGLFHVIEQLERAVVFQQASANWVQPADAADPEEEASRQRWWRLLRFAAYRLTVEAAARKQVFGEFQIDPDSYLADLPGYETLKHAEVAAETIACTPEEALAFARAYGAEDVAVLTVEGAAQAMRDFLDQRVASWD